MAQDTRTIRIEIANIQTNQSGMQTSTKKMTPEEKIAQEQREYKNRISNIINRSFNPFMSQLQDETKNSVQLQAKIHLAQQATSVIEQSIDYAITRHLNLTEDYISQNNYKMIKSTYSLAKGAAVSVASGAAAGAAFGPAGIAVGAAIGIIGYGVNTAISQSERYSQYYQQLNATSFNTQYNQKRAGLYDGSRGTEG